MREKREYMKWRELEKKAKEYIAIKRDKGTELEIKKGEIIVDTRTKKQRRIANEVVLGLYEKLEVMSRSVLPKNTDNETIQDVVQETSISTLRLIENYKPEQGLFCYFFYQRLNREIKFNYLMKLPVYIRNEVVKDYVDIINLSNNKQEAITCLSSMINNNNLNEKELERHKIANFIYSIIEDETAYFKFALKNEKSDSESSFDKAFSNERKELLTTSFKELNGENLEITKLIYESDANVVDIGTFYGVSRPTAYIRMYTTFDKLKTFKFLQDLI